MQRFWWAGAVVILAGCQTNYQYVRIGDGPDLARAQAQCEILSMGTERGVVAWGSPSYVAGAQIGNAIANDIRKQQFMKNCMILQGWAQIPPGSSAPQPPPEARNLVKADFPPAPGR